MCDGGGGGAPAFAVVGSVAAGHPGEVDIGSADRDGVVSGADAAARVTAALDPLLAGHGFAAGQASWGDRPLVASAENPMPYDGMVIYCRPLVDGSPGCEDVSVYLRAVPSWHVQRVLDDDPRGPWFVDYDVAPIDERLPEIVAELVARVLPPGPGLPGAAGP